MAEGVAPGITSLAQAHDVLAGPGENNVGRTLDMLHLTRTKTRPEDVAALPAGPVKYIQLCDGKAEMPVDRQRWEAGYGRLFPGEGEFVIDQYLRFSRVTFRSDLKRLGSTFPRTRWRAADLKRHAPHLSATAGERDVRR